MRRSPWLPWLFVAPAMVLVCLTVLVPALMALLMSFTRSGLDVITTLDTSLHLLIATVLAGGDQLAHRRLRLLLLEQPLHLAIEGDNLLILAKEDYERVPRALGHAADSVH